MSTVFSKFIEIAEKHANSYGEGVLGQEILILPPIDDLGYECSPRNILIFGHMGVDGVHYGILKINGDIRNDSPVVQISPMDSESVLVIADSFLNYLAIGCSVDSKVITDLLNEVDTGKLVSFLSLNFNDHRLFNKSYLERLNVYNYLIEKKV